MTTSTATNTITSQVSSFYLSFFFIELSDTVPAELLSGPLYDRLSAAAGLAMQTLFTDVEGNRRIELSRMQGGVLLGDILEQSVPVLVFKLLNLTFVDFEVR